MHSGDTVWSADVKTAIAKHRPPESHSSTEAGRALPRQRPLIMTTNDVQQVAARVPTVVVVHLEAINHRLGTRAIQPADGSRFPVERVAAAPASEFVTLYPQGTTTSRRRCRSSPPTDAIRWVEIGRMVR